MDDPAAHDLLEQDILDHLARSTGFQDVLYGVTGQL
jgi:hypothetical protein